MPGRIWILSAPVIGERVRQFFTSYFRKGIFSRLCKKAKLVLLRKESKSSAYRPIYLLNDVGKLLERVIASRIIRHLSRNGLSVGQYGFREKKSTINAIKQVCSLSEQLIAEGGREGVGGLIRPSQRL